MPASRACWRKPPMPSTSTTPQNAPSRYHRRRADSLLIRIPPPPRGRDYDVLLTKVSNRKREDGERGDAVELFGGGAEVGAGLDHPEPVGSADARAELRVPRQ